MALRDLYDNLSDEAKKRVREAETPKEIMALAKEEGIELTEEQLNSVAGGWGSGDVPKCTCFLI